MMSEHKLTYNHLLPGEHLFYSVISAAISMEMELWKQDETRLCN